ncbi:hypothetical protein K456DRAFT_1502570 [Colletotrichum gloeosporioides 23]|nr:hypothetical protein K456DRAFT_1502570 [Colletotrichum gloeosporioides 23]
MGLLSMGPSTGMLATSATLLVPTVFCAFTWIQSSAEDASFTLSLVSSYPSVDGDARLSNWRSRLRASVARGCEVSSLARVTRRGSALVEKKVSRVPPS